MYFKCIEYYEDDTSICISMSKNNVGYQEQAGITGHSMMKFNENFLIGRALALGDSSYDARNKDFVLQLNYNEATAPTKNKLVCMFVFHIRRLEIGADSVRVVV
mgnify:CR=1 FL=1